MRRGLLLAATLTAALIAADTAAAAMQTPCAEGAERPLCTFQGARDPGGGASEDTRLRRHVGRGSFVLADGRGVGSLRTTHRPTTDCAAWGDASCP